MSNIDWETVDTDDGVFEARLHGLCSECFEEIIPGEFIRRDGSDYVHAECWIDETKSTACPHCHLVHAGECF